MRGAQVYLVRNRSLHIFPGCGLLGAFYSEKLPRLTGRIVVLNTNLYYSNNKQTVSMADPGQQFQWLEEVLTNASQAGEMVRAPASSPPSLGSSTLGSAQTHPLSRDVHIKNSFITLARGGASILRTACEAGNLEPIADMRLPRGGDGLIYTISGGAEARDLRLQTPKSRAFSSVITHPFCILDLKGLPFCVSI